MEPVETVVILDIGPEAVFEFVVYSRVSVFVDVYDNASGSSLGEILKVVDPTPNTLYDLLYLLSMYIISEESTTSASGLIETPSFSKE